MGRELWKNGTKSKVEIHECVNDQNENYMFWAEQVGVDPPPPPPPQGESPTGYLRLDMNPDDVSS